MDHVWQTGDRIETPAGVQGVVMRLLEQEDEESHQLIEVRLGTVDNRPILAIHRAADLKPGVPIVTEADIKARGDAHLLAALG